MNLRFFATGSYPLGPFIMPGLFVAERFEILGQDQFPRSSKVTILMNRSLRLARYRLRPISSR